MPRTQITDKEIESTMKMIREALTKRLMQHGRGTFASTHEIYGIVAEEFDELRDALRSNSEQEFVNELIDVAVGAIFGAACIYSHKTDW